MAEDRGLRKTAIPNARDRFRSRIRLLKSRDPMQRKTPDKRGSSFARRIGDSVEAKPLLLKSGNLANKK